jgi:hypothetical protein
MRTQPWWTNIRRVALSLCAVLCVVATDAAAQQPAPAGEPKAESERAPNAAMVPPPGMSVQPPPDMFAVPDANDRPQGCPVRTLKPLELLV